MKYLILCAAFMLAGCGSFSQARVDGHNESKQNHVRDVRRALEGKLTAVELRSSLESIDKQILAEYAHKGSDADLEELRLMLLKQSDDYVAQLFDGDNGRTDPPASGAGDGS